MPTPWLRIKALLLNSTIAFTKSLGSILSKEDNKAAYRLISISRCMVVSGNSNSPTSDFLIPNDEPGPKSLSLTFLISFPTPFWIVTMAFCLAFRLVLPCTRTSTKSYCILGTSRSTTFFTSSANSFLKFLNMLNIFFSCWAMGPVTNKNRFQSSLLLL